MQHVIDLAIQLAPVVAAAIIAAFGFLLRSYLKSIWKAIKVLNENLSRHDGRSEMLHKEIRENTIETVKLRTEINAMWHFIDGASKRATDRR